MILIKSKAWQKQKKIYKLYITHTSYLGWSGPRKNKRSSSNRSNKIKKWNWSELKVKEEGKREKKSHRHEWMKRLLIIPDCVILSHSLWVVCSILSVCERFAWFIYFRALDSQYSPLFQWSYFIIYLILIFLSHSLISFCFCFFYCHFCGSIAKTKMKFYYWKHFRTNQLNW